MKKAAAILTALALTLGAGSIVPALHENAAIVASAESTYGDLTYMNYGDFIEITDCDLTVTTVEIPASIGGVPVTRIGEQAFRICEDLTSVLIPESVTSIGSLAFSGCISLTSISIPDSVTSIEYGAFLDCESLTSVTIPESGTDIGSGAFEMTPWLDNQLADNAFVVVNEIIIASNPELCLGDVVIPDGIKTIASYAFEGCKGMKSVSIAKSVIRIDYNPFANCTNLTDIYYEGSETEWWQIEGTGRVYNYTVHYAESSPETTEPSTDTPSSEIPDNSTYDLSGDGILNAADAAIILVYLAELGAGNTTLSLYEFAQTL